MYLLGQDDTLYPLPNTKFEHKLQNPTQIRLRRFAKRWVPTNASAQSTAQRGGRRRTYLNLSGLMTFAIQMAG